MGYILQDEILFKKFHKLLKKILFKDKISNMESYYIKIKQNQSEIEFSTSDKAEFNQKIQMLMKLSGVIDSIPLPEKVEKKQLEGQASGCVDKQEISGIEGTDDNQQKTRVINKNNDAELALLESIIEQSGQKKKLKNNTDEVPQEEAAADIVSVEPSVLKRKEAEKNEFEKILEKSMKNPKEQVSPNFSGDKKYKNLYTKKKITTIEQQLVFTAGYLLNYEGKDVFTLKDINRKIFPITQVPIGHGEINKTRVDGYIKVVPNYVDRTALTEYMLTQSGEQFYNELVSGKK